MSCSHKAPRFGGQVVERKKLQVFAALRHLAQYPRRPINPRVGLCTCPVERTPFVVIYDFDDRELRVHMIVHAHADLDRLDLSAVAW